MRGIIALLGLLVAGTAQANLSEEEIHCMAKNIYFEARNQSHTGKIAVALVTLNRVADGRYPDTVCGVVYQSYTWNGNPIRHKCQFSWYCDGKSDKIYDRVAWSDAVSVAYDAITLYSGGFDITNGATHYHTRYVDPHWASSLTFLGSIDEHEFYRWEK